MNLTVRNMLEALHKLNTQEPRHRDYAFFMNEDQILDVGTMGALSGLIHNLRMKLHKNIGTLMHRRRKIKSLHRLYKQHYNRLFAEERAALAARRAAMPPEPDGYVGQAFGQPIYKVSE